MPRLVFGKPQSSLVFENNEDFFLCLGFVTRNSRITCEHNELQGAWRPEGRLEFRGLAINVPLSLRRKVRVGGDLRRNRINCSDYVTYLITDFSFIETVREGMTTILVNSPTYSELRRQIPVEFVSYFDAGYQMTI